MQNINLNGWKPQLLPNNKTEEAPDWEDRIENPSRWLVSNKYDGGRIELFSDGTVKGRSLKSIPSVHIQRMGRDISLLIQVPETLILEGEFYSPNMNFAEIMHFFRSVDVTSSKNILKYQKLWTKSGGDPDKGWTFPGRTVEWVTSWHSCLKFYMFDSVTTINFSSPKEVRNQVLQGRIEDYTAKIGGFSPDMVYVKQNSISHIDELYQAYDQAIIDGLEGVVVMHKDSPYKSGRHTLKAKMAFKIKNDNFSYDAKILSVVEGTVAREGAAKKVNELGRSKTSQLKEDRIPSGMASGLEVLLEDGQILVVSLKGYNHGERREMLRDHADYSNKWIRFTAMEPVKLGGVPRHAMFTKGNLRDDK